MCSGSERSRVRTYSATGASGGGIGAPFAGSPRIVSYSNSQLTLGTYSLLWFSRYSRVPRNLLFHRVHSIRGRGHLCHGSLSGFGYYVLVRGLGSEKYLVEVLGALVFHHPSHLGSIPYLWYILNHRGGVSWHETWYRQHGGALHRS